MIENKSEMGQIQSLIGVLKMIESDKEMKVRVVEIEEKKANQLEEKF